MLKGKIAWVTGAGTGIGLAGARALAEAGALVVMSGRRADVLAAEADAISATGAAVEVEPLAVGRAQDVERVAASILGVMVHVDILVNSAGLTFPNVSGEKQTYEGWDEVIGSTFNGTYYCIAAVLPSMRSRKDGLVLSTSPRGRAGSTRTRRGPPTMPRSTVSSR